MKLVAIVCAVALCSSFGAMFVQADTETGPEHAVPLRNLPLQIVTTGDSSVAVISVQPWPMGYVKIIRPDGTEEYIRKYTIRAIADARGRDWTKQVLDGGESVGMSLSEYDAVVVRTSKSRGEACLDLVSLRIATGTRIKVNQWSEQQRALEVVEGQFLGTSRVRDASRLLVSNGESHSTRSVAASDLHVIRYWKRGKISSKVTLVGLLFGGVVGGVIGNKADPPSSGGFLGSSEPHIGGALPGALVGMCVGAALGMGISARIPSERTIRCR